MCLTAQPHSLVDYRDGHVQPVLDDRIDHLPDYSRAGITAVRNKPGGFWVAQADPAAASPDGPGAAGPQAYAWGQRDGSGVDGVGRRRGDQPHGLVYAQHRLRRARRVLLAWAGSSRMNLSAVADPSVRTTKVDRGTG